MTATVDEVQAWLEGDHDTRTEAYGFARQLLAALQAVERLREREAQIWNGDYCEHGIDCTGTGPECARAGTVQEARQRGWDEAVALSNDAARAALQETGGPTPPRCPTCGSLWAAVRLFTLLTRTTCSDPWHAGQPTPEYEQAWVSGHPGVHERDTCHHGCEREGCEPVFRKVKQDERRPEGDRHDV